MELQPVKGDGEPWRVLEFYSGIGGMRYSLLQAEVLATILEAFDINDKANDVYQHNFGHRPYQGNIQSFTAAELDKFGAHAWLLSPPCQPYTRQGLQMDARDARASSFLKILELIPQTLQPPFMLFVENVVGFETSETHKHMMGILGETGFVTQEYVLSPLQFGVPYSRPRYFCLAKRKPLSFRSPFFNHQLLWDPTPFLLNEDNTWMDGCRNDHVNVGWKASHASCKSIKDFLETKTLSSTCSENEDSDSCESNVCKMVGEVVDEPRDGSTDGFCTPDARKSSLPHRDLTDNFQKNDGKICSQDSSINRFTVPLDLIERWGSAMDIVFPDARRCCCFTKSYHRYVKGTGSFLVTVQAEKKVEVSSLRDLGLRYFTPREVANLHSFPEDFDFPKHITLNQRYALLGNSLSVAVVAPLLRYLFTQPS